MSAYAMFKNSPLPVVLKSSCPKPTFSLSSTVTPAVPTLQKLPGLESKTRDGDNAMSNVFDDETKNTIITTSNSSINSNNDIGIAVKSANVDCKRLIAATARNRRRPRLTKHIVDDNNYIGDRVTTNSDKDNSSSSAWEEAVQFEISITLNDRTYTRSRSFPRIVRLRNELVKEVKNRRRNHPGRFGVLRSLVYGVAGSSSESCSSVNSDEQQRMEYEEVSTDNLCDVKNMSITRMQSTLNGRYCPAIEIWLQSVLSSELIDPHTSPSLADFLKEDSISDMGAGAANNKKKTIVASKRQTKWSSQLWSILEDRPCMANDYIKSQFSADDCMDDCLVSAEYVEEENECDVYDSAI